MVQSSSQWKKQACCQAPIHSSLQGSSHMLLVGMLKHGVGNDNA